MPSANQEKIWIMIGKQYSGKGKKGHLRSVSPLPAGKKNIGHINESSQANCSLPECSPPPRVFDLWCHRVVGGLKRPQNLVRGVYVDWFDFYSDLKIPLY